MRRASEPGVSLAARALAATRARQQAIIANQHPSLMNITDLVNAVTGYREMEHNVAHPIERLKSGTRWDNQHQAGLGPVQAGIVMPGGLGGLSRRAAMDQNYQNALRILGDAAHRGPEMAVDERNYLAAQRILGEKPPPWSPKFLSAPPKYQGQFRASLAKPGEPYKSFEGGKLEQHMPLPQELQGGGPGARTWNFRDPRTGQLGGSLVLQRAGKESYIHSAWVDPELRKSPLFLQMMNIATKGGKQAPAGTAVNKRLAALYARKMGRTK